MFEFLVRQRINSALKNNKRKHSFKNLESIQNVLILFSYSDWLDVQAIMHDLEQNGKNVVLWTTSPANLQPNNNTSPLPPNVRIISKKEKSLFQIIKHNVIAEFRNLSYDTLIDFTTKRSRTLKYLLVQNSSDFCIGIRETDKHIYDYIFLKEDDKSLQETYYQLKNYLNNMNSCTN